MSWNVPRGTHTYFVENLLATDFRTLREQILVRYVKFFRQLLVSKSEEVRLLATLVAHDVTSNTGNNLARLKLETGLDPWTGSLHSFREKLASDRVAVPPQDEWRLEYLDKLIKLRNKMENNLENVEKITELIESLCVT